MADILKFRVNPAKGRSVANPGVPCTPAALEPTMMLMKLGDSAIGASSCLPSPGTRCICSRQAPTTNDSARDCISPFMVGIRTLQVQKCTNCIMNPEGAPGVKIISGQRKQRWRFRMHDHGGTNG